MNLRHRMVSLYLRRLPKTCTLREIAPPTRFQEIRAEGSPPTSHRISILSPLRTTSRLADTLTDNVCAPVFNEHS